MIREIDKERDTEIIKLLRNRQAAIMVRMQRCIDHAENRQLEKMLRCYREAVIVINAAHKPAEMAKPDFSDDNLVTRD